jgi:hypothetical protein
LACAKSLAYNNRIHSFNEMMRRFSMLKLVRLLLAVGLFLTLTSTAYAAGVSDQVKDAVVKGDFNLVQSLVGKNPGATGKAEDALLKRTYGKLVDDPEHAAKAMSTASYLAPGIIPPDAQSVVDGLEKIVKLITDKSLLICNPEANANSGELQTPVDPKKIAAAKAVAAVLDDAGKIAQLPVIVAVQPQLFAQIQAASAQCETGDEASLAQMPHLPQHLPPHLVPVPDPRPHPASPD